MPVENHDDLISAKSDAILWRYMNLEKFISLLRTQSLFFCRCDKFSDPFEGTYPKKEIEYRPKTYQEIYRYYNIPYTQEKFEENKQKRISFNRRNRAATVINCWHINKYESDSMWRLYLKTNEGVAIQSTPHRICNSLKETDETIYSSKIRYIDFDNSIWYDKDEYPIEVENTMTPFIHKRIEFNNESEFRLFHIVNDVLFYQGEDYWKNQENHLGKFIKVNIIELIEKVVFPPTLNVNDQKLIERIASDMGFHFCYCKSTLSNQPEL